MRFLVDTQLPFKLAVYLRSIDIDCLHTTDYERGHLFGDDQIARIASAEDRIIITKDADFVDSYNLSGAPPKVLYLTFGNQSNKSLLNLFSNHFHLILAEFTEGAEFIEFGRAGYVDRTFPSQ